MKTHYGLLSLLLLSACSGSSDTAKTAAPPVDKGYELYTRHCSSCHGAEAVSGSLPDLRMATDDVYKDWQKQVMKGSGDPLGMPAFENKLSPEDAELIKAYVLKQRSAH